METCRSSKPKDADSNSVEGANFKVKLDAVMGAVRRDARSRKATNAGKERSPLFETIDRLKNPVAANLKLTMGHSHHAIRAEMSNPPN